MAKKQTIIADMPKHTQYVYFNTHC